MSEIDPNIKLAIIEETNKAKSHSIKVFTVISTAIGFVAGTGTYFGITGHINSKIEDSGLTVLVKKAQSSLDSITKTEKSVTAIHKDIAENNPVKIMSGSCSSNQDDSLNKGNGDRSKNIPITFKSPFSSTPDVVISFSKLDVINGANHRVRVEAVDKSSKGFTCRISTWTTTRVYSSTAQWIAYGK